MATEIDVDVSYTYGTRGGSNEYRFKPDDKQRKFHLDGTVPDEIILTYISTGIDSATTNYIPVYMESVLEAYLDWQLAMNNPRATLGDREMRRKDYFQALGEAKKLEAPSVLEVKDIIRKTKSQGIRS